MGVLAGRKASGTDLSPVATLVSTARTAGPELATPLSASRKLTEAARRRVPTSCRVCRACTPHVADELGRLRDGIFEHDPGVQPVLWAVFSSIVV